VQIQYIHNREGAGFADSGGDHAGILVFERLLFIHLPMRTAMEQIANKSRKAPMQPPSMYGINVPRPIAAAPARTALLNPITTASAAHTIQVVFESSSGLFILGGTTSFSFAT
jgi:hypothetical protein